jgi:hypothetical protein
MSAGLYILSIGYGCLGTLDSHAAHRSKLLLSVHLNLGPTIGDAPHPSQETFGCSMADTGRKGEYLTFTTTGVASLWPEKDER